MQEMSIRQARMETNMAKMRNRIFALEEEVRGARQRESDMCHRWHAAVMRLEEGRRWERAFRQRKESADAPSRMLEERLDVVLRLKADARRREEGAR